MNSKKKLNNDFFLGFTPIFSIKLHETKNYIYTRKYLIFEWRNVTTHKQFQINRKNSYKLIEDRFY